MSAKTCKKCGEGYTGERCKPCRNARMAKHYAENRDRMIAKSAAWRAANPDKVRARSAAYRAQKHEQVLAAQAAWREANPERHRAWRHENAARMRELRVAWWKAHPEAAAAYWAKRRAQKNNATPVWFGDFDAFAVREAYHLSRLRKKVTGFDWHVDHVVPLQGKRVCGLHVAINLSVIPATINMKKNNSYGERHV